MFHGVGFISCHMFFVVARCLERAWRFGEVGGGCDPLSVSACQFFRTPTSPQQPNDGTQQQTQQTQTRPNSPVWPACPALDGWLP